MGYQSLNENGIYRFFKKLFIEIKKTWKTTPEGSREDRRFENRMKGRKRYDGRFHGGVTDPRAIKTLKIKREAVDK